MSERHTSQSRSGREGQRRTATRRSREETTERILDAAEELFATHNPLDVTVRDIAKRAGVTHALVHQYVGTKDDLVNAVVQRVAVDYAGLAEQGASLDQALQTIARDVLTNRMRSTSLVRSAMDGVEYLSLKERVRTGQALLRLAEATAASGATPGPPPRGLDHRVIMAALTAMVFGWTAMESWLHPIYGLDPDDADETREQLLEIVTYVADLVLLPDETSAGTDSPAS